MKQIFTLLAIVCIAVTANAQNFTENFEGTLVSCYANTNVTITTGNAISGKSAILTNTGTSILATPYLNLSSSVTIKFDYALSGPLNGSKTRVLQVGIQDKNGAFQALSGTFNATSTATTNFNQTYTVTDGTYRVVVKETGDGANDVVYFDNLNVSAPLHYSATCNPAPVAGSNSFSTSASGAYSNKLTATDADLEVLTFAVATQPASGTVTVATDGTFTFTPNAGFTGSQVTFTYKVTDNGYDAASTTATATINYIAQASLPIHIVSFNGSIANHKAALSWSVTENETGDHFVIEKSLNGSSFNQNAVVFTTNKQGSETYSYADASFNGLAYYRFKIINKDGTIAYSKTITLKEAGDATANSLSLQNPVTSNLNYSITANTTGAFILNIYNTAGVKVYTSQVNLQKGMNAASLSVDSKVAPGIYILEITNGSDKNIAKFVKQ